MLTGVRPFDPLPWQRKKSVIALLRRQTEYERLQAGVRHRLGRLRSAAGAGAWERGRASRVALVDLPSIFTSFFGSFRCPLSHFLFVALPLLFSSALLLRLSPGTCLLIFHSISLDRSTDSHTYVRGFLY